MVKGKRACDACYKRKIQCDASKTRENCDWCQYHSLQCTFNRVGGKMKFVTSTLPTRQDQIETDVGQSISSEMDEKHPVPPSESSYHHTDQSQALPYKILIRACAICQSELPKCSSLSNTALLGQISFTGKIFGTVCSGSGNLHFTPKCEEWIYVRTGQFPHFRRIISNIFRKDSDKVIRAALPQLHPVDPNVEYGKIHLPEIGVLGSWVQILTMSKSGFANPPLDLILLEKVIKLAHREHSSPELPEHTIAKACVFSFMALLGTSAAGPQAVPLLDSIACAEKAKSLVAEYPSNVSIAKLLAVLMLLLHEMSRGHLQAASNFLTIACRTVFGLGGHTVSVPLAKGPGCVLTLQERESRYVRMLFWYCYTLDKTISLHMGQPAVISDDLCDLRLSESTQRRFFVSYHRQAIELYADSRDTLETFLYRRLSIIKSKAIRKLYSPVSLQMSRAELLHSIRKLDEELEGWRASIPAELLVVSSVQWPSQTYQYLHQLGGMRQIELQLDYYFVLSIVHCAIGRCMADVSPAEPEGVLDGRLSSIELAMAASRSTLRYLLATKNLLAGKSFWLVILYPMSASMTLFFNVLRQPSHENATHDIELLDKTSDFISDLELRMPAGFDVQHLRNMSALIAELSSLSKCAISRSQTKRKCIF